jgi:hypothetical protein
MWTVLLNLSIGILAVSLIVYFKTHPKAGKLQAQVPINAEIRAKAAAAVKEKTDQRREMIELLRTVYQGDLQPDKVPVDVLQELVYELVRLRNYARKHGLKDTDNGFKKLFTEPELITSDSTDVKFETVKPYTGTETSVLLEHLGVPDLEVKHLPLDFEI